MPYCDMNEHVLLERYFLMKPLGKGGFAKTYLARDSHHNDRLCVVKHLTPANDSAKFLATARRLFAAEADVLRRLGCHAQIPELIDAFESEGEFYLVQAYIDGEPLDRDFQLQDPLSEAEIVELLQQALPILAFIHRQQVIHRDIKPSNLMRRREDGKLVLIDFGAVKEITTQAHIAGREEFTVSIGTQGYAPPEQLAGRPRYSSDLYALGMTMIRGLTGRSPTELPENPHTGELLWYDDSLNISSGLMLFLRRLTHPSIYQRYASAEVALQDLQHLETLAFPPAIDFPETVLNPHPKPRYPWGGAIALFIVTAIVLLIRQLGGWMPLELLIYDEWIQQQADLGQDDRLLLVEITEDDLRALKRTTPSDATLNQAIQTLQAHEPRVIGVDLYRGDVPQGEGHEALLQTFASGNIVAIQKIGNRASEAIPPPATVPPERVGFNDFPVDPDGVIRRNLLFADTNNTPNSETLYSFSLRLALAYLEAEDILPVASEVNPRYLALDETVFYPIGRHFGGYRAIDDAGYQVMLQYRSQSNPVERLSLSDLLSGQFTDSMIRDRIIIIGTTAPSAKDLFYTPFSEAAAIDHLMPGVVLHVQATSQLLSHVLDEQPLRGQFPEGVEIAWILLASGAGGALGWYVRRLWLLGCGVIGGSIVLISLPALAFMAGGWVPLLPANAAFVSSLVVIALYRTRQPPQTAISHSFTFATASPQTAITGMSKKQT